MNTESRQNRVVLITGAAGGLGQGLVAAFLAEGWRVAAGYHRTSVPSNNEALWTVPLDVTRPQAPQEAVAGVLSRWGRLDVCINNAGVNADQTLPRMTEVEWDHVLEVNLSGAARCARAVLAPMCAQGSGHIINISSFAARVGARGQTNYAAAKAGLLGLTLALAREVGSHQVCVNAVLPGVLATAMTAALDPSVRAANVLGRLNDIAEVARFVVFLTTLNNVSGQVFQLDSRIAPWC